MKLDITEILNSPEKFKTVVIGKNGSNHNLTFEGGYFSCYTVGKGDLQHRVVVNEISYFECPHPVKDLLSEFHDNLVALDNELFEEAMCSSDTSVYTGEVRHNTIIKDFSQKVCTAMNSLNTQVTLVLNRDTTSAAAYFFGSVWKLEQDSLNKCK